jgi:tricorn protease
MALATPVLEAADVAFSPDGSKVAYNRLPSNRGNWRRYRGGSQGFISIYDLKNNAYRELPHQRENSWNPMWIGDSIYFVSDKNLQTVNLYRYDLGSNKEVQLTHYTDADIHWPSSDGKTIVFERDGYLYRYDIASGNAYKVTPKVKGDLLATRPQLRRLAGDISNVTVSPSGLRVAVEARGELFSSGELHGSSWGPCYHARGRPAGRSWKTCTRSSSAPAPSGSLVRPCCPATARRSPCWSATASRVRRPRRATAA